MDQPMNQSFPLNDVSVIDRKIDRGCNHTLIYRTEQGVALGTWIEETGDYGIRVSCQVCGKFYGYLPHASYRTEQAAMQAYSKQKTKPPSS